MRPILVVIVVTGVLVPLGRYTPVAWGEDALVTVVPELSDEILANPGMGWETFHHTAQQDRNLPAWIPSTVHYLRWGWGELEPRPGQIDFALVDRVLRATHASGQTLAFRVMCCSSTPGRPYHPKWLKEIGGTVLDTRYGGSRPLEVPDLDDPATLNAHLDFIRRLGARYDGHPDIDHIDLGSVGWWGEWHMSESTVVKMPKLDNQKKIVDTYLAAFQKTPLLMLVNGGEMLRYAHAHGTGWRADCLGDLGVFWRKWSHMKVGYPTWLRDADALDVWKQHPVAWETGGDIRHWVMVGNSLRYIFNYALALHASYINNKSAPLPPGKYVRAEVERFLRRLGYRLVLRQFRHLPQATAGKELELTMQWQNTGSAPCYRPYHLAYRFRNEQGYDKVIASRVTVNHWMPGSVELFTKDFFKQPPDLPPGKVVPVTDRIRLPANMPAGTYRLSVGIVSDTSRKPIVRLGIKGRTEQGWYPLGWLPIRR